MILKYLSVIIYFAPKVVWYSDVNIANPTFFWLLISWYIFFQCFLYNTFMSLKYTSCRQHIIGSYFFVQPYNVYLLFGSLYPFNVIINMVIFEFIILIFSIFLFFILFFLFPVFFWINLVFLFLLLA